MRRVKNGELALQRNYHGVEVEERITKVRPVYRRQAQNHHLAYMAKERLYGQSCDFKVASANKLHPSLYITASVKIPINIHEVFID